MSAGGSNPTERILSAALPDAVLQNPACGACGGETTFDGDHSTCDDCQLCFDTDDLSAAFLDPEAEPCGAPCDNGWHGDHKIRQGMGFDCGTCRLPTGHESLHWTDCQMREAADDPVVGGSEHQNGGQ